jgi:uncharacterized OB-fold protein
MDGRPVPVVDDIDTGPFFAAAQRGELAVQVCNQCDAVLHLPRAYCQDCGSWDSRWQATNGRGRLYSWTVATHQVMPSMPVPYTIVMVAVDEYPTVRLLGYLEGEPELHEGQAMQVRFDQVTDDVVVPHWDPVPGN